MSLCNINYVILFPSTDVEVHWTTSGTIPVTEGDGVEVRLSGQAIGLYANPIAIGFICTDGIATGIEPSGVWTPLPHGHAYNWVCNLTLPCYVQPSLAETSTSQLEPSCTSLILTHLEASHAIKLYQSSMMT